MLASSEECDDEERRPLDVGDLQLEFRSVHDLGNDVFDDELRHVRTWHVEVSAPYDDENPAERHLVGHMTVLVVHGDLEDTWNVLDNYFDIDVRHVADEVLVLHPAKVRKIVEASDEAGFGWGFAIIEHVSLVEAWRGRGLGPVLAAQALAAIASETQYCALQAAPVRVNGADRTSGDERARAQRRLARMWRRAGFRTVAGDVMAAVTADVIAAGTRALRAQAPV